MEDRTAALEDFVGGLESFLEEVKGRRPGWETFPKLPVDEMMGIWREALDRTPVNQYHNYEYLSDTDTENIRNLFYPFWEELLIAKRYQLGEDIKSIKKTIRMIPDTFGSMVLRNFFLHDINHLKKNQANLLYIIGNFSSKRDIEIMKEYGDEIKLDVRLFNSDPEFFYSIYTEPYNMAHFMGTTELGMSPKKWDFQPSQLVSQIALNLRYRDPNLNYGVASTNTDTNRNMIITDTEDFTLNGNSGLVFSILYNLAKNAYKKLSDEPDQGHRITMQVYEAPWDSYVITVADNGSPIDVNLMKEKLRDLVLYQGIDNVLFATADLMKKTAGWQHSEYKVGDLTMKDITDIAFMGRMSGFDNQDHFSSGMGLYGVRYLVDHMGGRILYGENFEDGSPIFSVILPKHLPENNIERMMYGIGTRLNARKFMSYGNQRKVA